MKHIPKPAGFSGRRLLRLHIDTAPAGDGTRVLPRITLREVAGDGVLICIGACGFGIGGGVGDRRAIPATLAAGA